jgi:hypothetical protein
METAGILEILGYTPTVTAALVLLKVLFAI